MLEARDIVRALLRIENAIEDAADELGIDLVDLIEHLASPEVQRLLELMEYAQRLGDSVLARRLNRGPVLTLHAIASRNPDDPDLPPAERVRRCEAARKASVALLRLSHSLTIDHHHFSHVPLRAPLVRNEVDHRDQVRHGDDRAEAGGQQQRVRADRRSGSECVIDHHSPRDCESQSTAPDSAPHEPRDTDDPPQRPHDLLRMRTLREAASNPLPAPTESIFPPGHPYGPPRSPPAGAKSR